MKNLHAVLRLNEFDASKLSQKACAVLPSSMAGVTSVNGVGWWCAFVKCLVVHSEPLLKEKLHAPV